MTRTHSVCVCLCVTALALLVGCQANRRAVGTADQADVDMAQARHAAVQLMLALKHGSVADANEWLWDKSLDSRVVKAKGKDYLQQIAHHRHLDQMSDAEISRAVRVIQCPHRSLLEEYASFQADLEMQHRKEDNRQMVPLGIKAPNGIDYFLLMVFTGGHWRSAGLPSVTTAIVGHKHLDKALADPDELSAFSDEPRPAAATPGSTRGEGR